MTKREASFESLAYGLSAGIVNHLVEKSETDNKRYKFVRSVGYLYTKKPAEAGFIKSELSLYRLIS